MSQKYPEYQIMNKNEIICNNIKTFYKENYLHECGTCAETKQCGVSQNPKYPYIGLEYGNNRDIPKLLFLSLDSGNSGESYTIENIRQNVLERVPRENKGKNKHWYQTFDIAKLILEKFVNNINIDDDKKFEVPYLAHTNSAKCSQNKLNRRQADDKLFINCKKYIIQELPLLEPDILITQGKKAAECILDSKCSEKIREISNNILEISLRHFNIDKKKFIYIRMYHPRYYKKYWTQKKEITEKIINEIRHSFLKDLQ